VNAGVPDGDQLSASVHLPPDCPTHVRSTANANIGNTAAARTKAAENERETKLRSILLFMSFFLLKTSILPILYSHPFEKHTPESGGVERVGKVLS